jgi:hypothetical protein
VNRAAAFALAAMVAVAIAGCATRPVRPANEPVPPTASSAAEALRLFEWSYNYRVLVHNRGLFSGDYRFILNPQDSAGAEYRNVPWTRTEELNST